MSDSTEKKETQPDPLVEVFSGAVELEEFGEGSRRWESDDEKQLRLAKARAAFVEQHGL